MANKTVGELPRASTIGLNDLFVLEQGNQAKSLTGQTLINDLADALDAHGGIASASYNSSNYTLTLTFADQTTFTTGNLRGATGAKGNTGNTGNGISSITKTGTNGLSDTYTVTFTSGNTTTFSVANGNGIVSISKQSTSGLTDTYKCLLDDGSYQNFTVTNGKSITGVTLLSGSHAPGTNDTYRISFNDGTNVDFPVYNGLNGSGSVGSVNDVSPDVNGNVQLQPSSIGAQDAIVGLTETDALVDGDKFAIHKNNTSDVFRITWANVKAKLTTVFAAKTHASTHATGGADAITPANIGAAASTHASTHSTGGADAITPANIGAADATHASRHASGGADALPSNAIVAAMITNGAVSRAKLANDALYSPIAYQSSSRTIELNDLGKTISFNSASATTYTVTKAVSDTLPTGFEVAIIRYNTGAVNIELSGGIFLVNSAEATRLQNGKARIAEQYSLVALKKVDSTTWLLTGNAENY